MFGFCLCFPSRFRDHFSSLQERTTVGAVIAHGMGEKKTSPRATMSGANSAPVFEQRARELGVPGGLIDSLKAAHVNSFARLALSNTISTRSTRRSSAV